MRQDCLRQPRKGLAETRFELESILFIGYTGLTWGADSLTPSGLVHKNQ